MCGGVCTCRIAKQVYTPWARRLGLMWLYSTHLFQYLLNNKMFSSVVPAVLCVSMYIHTCVVYTYHYIQRESLLASLYVFQVRLCCFEMIVDSGGIQTTNCCLRTLWYTICALKLYIIANLKGRPVCHCLIPVCLYVTISLVFWWRCATFVVWILLPHKNREGRKHGEIAVSL